MKSCSSGGGEKITQQPKKMKSSSSGGGGKITQQPKKRKRENLLIRQGKKIKTEKLRIPYDLPDDINHYLMAFVDRWDYPSLACSCRGFRDLIASPRVFQSRSQLGKKKSFLYTLFEFCGDQLSWYLLHPKNNSLRFTKMANLPPLHNGSTIVTYGHNIYIIGGGMVESPLANVSVLDCRFQTFSSLPDMQKPRCHAAAGVIDGNIYVIGGCNKQDEDWVEIYDANKNLWKTVSGPNPKDACSDGVFDAFVVMKGMFYLWCKTYCFVYQARQHQWMRGNISIRRSILQGLCCVVEDRLYTIDGSCYRGSPIIFYDTMTLGWSPVQGVSSSDLQSIVFAESKMMSFDDKLMILGQRQRTDIGFGCIVIGLERRLNGGNAEIWGTVETNSYVCTCLELGKFELGQTVTI